jgi:type II secretion system protein H
MNREQNSKPETRNPKRGFTLVEMLIVVTVMGLLATVVIPTLNSASSMISLEAAARTLAADLQIARQSAVQYNSTYAVTFDLAANSYQIKFTGTGSPPALSNLLTSSSTNGNLIDFDQWTASRLKQARVVLAGAALKVSKQSVLDVTFSPSGGTGPGRVQDTVIWLTQGSGTDRLCVLLTISWLTGNVTVGDVFVFPSTQVRPTF